MNNEQKKLKLFFLGKGQFGETILQGLIRTGYEPVAINDFKKIKKLKPDLVVVASYGKIFPKEILKIPQYGCLNVHASLLPKYRGPSPVQTAILNGDKETGVTIFLMDEKIDQGPILAQREWEIANSKINYRELLKKLANLGAKLLVETLPKWIAGKIKPNPQDDLRASYTKLLKREDGKIDWTKPAQEIERQVRAFHPWPGAFTFHKGKRIKILEADISKNNKLVIKKLQPEGKKPMTAEEFKRGHRDFNPLF